MLDVSGHRNLGLWLIAAQCASYLWGLSFSLCFCKKRKVISNKRMTCGFVIGGAELEAVRERLEGPPGARQRERCSEAKMQNEHHRSGGLEPESEPVQRKSN